MGWKFLQSFLLMSSIFIMLFVAFYAFKHRNMKTSLILFFMMISALIWTVGDYFEIQSNDVTYMIFWRNFQQIGAFTLPVLSLLLSIQITQRKHLYTFAWFSLGVAVASVLLIYTNELHYFMRLGYEVLESDTFGNVLVVKSTLLGLILVSYNFMLPIIAIISLSIHYQRVSTISKSLILIFIIAFAWTVLSAFLKVSLLSGIGLHVSISVLYIPTVILIFYGLFRYNFFTIAPIAREKIFDISTQGVIVSDELGAVVDYNSYAYDLFSHLEHPLELRKATLIDILGRVEILEIKYLDNAEIHRDVRIFNKGEEMFFLMKSYPIASKKKGLMGHICIFTNQTLQKLQADDLVYRATYDYLSKVLNRISFEKEYEKNSRPNRAIACMVIDIDNFKKINDQYGHRFGDEVIIRLAKLLQVELLPNNIVGRIGGEEFGIVLFDVTKEEASEVAEELRTKIELMNIDFEDVTIHFTVSIGVSHNEQVQRNYYQMMKEADIAMYHAKQTTRNAVVMYQADLK